MASCVVDRDCEKTAYKLDVSIKQSEGDLGCWRRLLSREPSARRSTTLLRRRLTLCDFCQQQQIVHCVRFLRLAGLLLQLRNWHYRSFYIYLFFWRFVVAHLISWFSSTAITGQCLSTFPWTRSHLQTTSSACGWRCDWHCTRCCGLRLETASLWIPSFPFLLQRLDDAGEDQRQCR